MKTKFLLMLITLSGLCWGTNSAAANVLATTSDRNSAQLSQTISHIIGLGQDTHSLVELAIDRALIAQAVNQPPAMPRTAGVPLAQPTPQPTQPAGKVTEPKPQVSKTPAITGKIDPPNPSVGQTKVKKTKKPKPKASTAGEQPIGLYLKYK
jgi:hypothetical protein